MGLIKSTNAPPSLQPFSMKDVEAAAKSVLLRAKLQAEQLLAAAQREADGIRESAREEGRREGFEQGAAEGVRQGAEAGRREAFDKHAQELSAALLALTTAAVTLDAGRRDLESQALREVVQLAAAIARRVTKRQGLIDEAVLAANVAEAMGLAVGAADVRIAFHPAQRAALNGALPALRAEWPALKHVELVEDATLAPGGCRIYTRGGMINADLDTQLDRVIDDLLPAAEKGPTS